VVCGVFISHADAEKRQKRDKLFNKHPTKQNGIALLPVFFSFAFVFVKRVRNSSSPKFC
jgi:hypothetical protein